MPNILERYFDEALFRIEGLQDTQDLPRPEQPEDAGFDPAERANADDQLLTLDEASLFALDSQVLGERDRVSFPLSDQERALLDGALREVGFDVYAFYKSRRHLSARPYPGKWGIFYLRHGISRIAELIEATYPGSGVPEQLAHDFLRQHERFHLKFDLYSLSVEANLGRHLYSPLKRAFRSHRVWQVEEAVANREAWDWAKRSRVAIEDFAFDFMKLQPGAYARFDEERFALTSELAANLLDLDLSVHARRDDQSLWIGDVPQALLRRSLCPEYLVEPAALTSWISPAWKLPEVRAVVEAQPFAAALDLRYSALKGRWEETKKRLIENPALPGLDFKRWDKATGEWSVRINRNFRAHIRPISAPSPGTWEASSFGTHTAMGHG